MHDVWKLHLKNNIKKIGGENYNIQRSLRPIGKNNFI
jgi:hypothetical protein